MTTFRYLAASSLEHSLTMVQGAEGGAAPLAGGTELLGLLKTGLARPSLLIDLKPIRGLARIATGARRIDLGALVTLATIADDPTILRRLTALGEAAVAVGTPQIRNRATVGGNLCQRPRCLYLRSGFRCFKTGDRGCPALEGSAENLAILGAERSPCVAVHPSDPAVALAVFDVKIALVSAEGRRTLGLESFFEPPDGAPFAETALGPGELVRAIQVTLPRAGTRSSYVKAKDRSAFAFALVSAAAAIRVTRGVVQEVRIALGGVARAPWRARRAEARLVGRRLTASMAREAAELEMEAARPLRANGFKKALAVNVLTQALTQAAGLREID